MRSWEAWIWAAVMVGAWAALQGLIGIVEHGGL
jgi:hypothetical protein